MKIIDPNDPFYRPLWRRIVLVGVLAGWAAFELLITREPIWMTVSSGLFLLAAWIFLIAWPKNSAH